MGRAEAAEVLFDDRSDSPFALHTELAAFDRVPPDSDAGKPCRLSVWVLAQDGRTPAKVIDLPCVYRRARAIPDLRPWEQY